MAKLNEMQLRRPEFREGVAIRLLDGQDWEFPIPYRIWRPTFDGDGRAGARDEWSWDGATEDEGREYAERIEKIATAELTADVYRLEFEAIRQLMRVNYDIADADLAGLVALARSPGSPAELVELTNSLDDLVYGKTRPKSATGTISG